MAGGESYTLTLDQGGHASRALVFDRRGRVAAAAEYPIRTRRSGRNRVEHAPRGLVRSMLAAAETALHKLPHSADVHSAALATQRSSIACWDRVDGRALSPVISWQDRRAARRVAALAAHGQQVRTLSGLVLSPHYGASKLAWCLEHLPAVRSAERHGRLAAGPLASFLLSGLLAEHPCLADPVNGARTQLLDTREGRWSGFLGELFGVPLGILPACVPNRHGFGQLHLCGREIPLQVVTGDQPAALFAAGMPQAGTAYVNVGTGAFIQAVTSSDVSSLLQSLIWRSENETLYALEGTVNGAGGALDTAAAKLGLPAGKVLRLLPGWLAAEAEPLLCLNGVGGLGSPYWRPAFPTRFIGRGTAGQKLSGVLESVAFLLMANLDAMQGGGAGITRMVVSGGLAQLDGLCQRLADLSGLPVERPLLHEATALGAARLAGGIGELAPLPRAVFTPAANPALIRRRARWQDAMQAALLKQRA